MSDEANPNTPPVTEKTTIPSNMIVTEAVINTPPPTAPSPREPQLEPSRQPSPNPEEPEVEVVPPSEPSRQPCTTLEEPEEKVASASEPSRQPSTTPEEPEEKVASASEPSRQPSTTPEEPEEKVASASEPSRQPTANLEDPEVKVAPATEPLRQPSPTIEEPEVKVAFTSEPLRQPSPTLEEPEVKVAFTSEPLRQPSPTLEEPEVKVASTSEPLRHSTAKLDDPEVKAGHPSNQGTASYEVLNVSGASVNASKDNASASTSVLLSIPIRPDASTGAIPKKSFSHQETGELGKPKPSSLSLSEPELSPKRKVEEPILYRSRFYPNLPEGTEQVAFYHSNNDDTNGISEDAEPEVVVSRRSQRHWAEKSISDSRSFFPPHPLSRPSSVDSKQSDFNPDLKWKACVVATMVLVMLMAVRNILSDFKIPTKNANKPVTIITMCEMVLMGLIIFYLLWAALTWAFFSCKDSCEDCITRRCRGYQSVEESDPRPTLGAQYGSV